MGNKLRGALVSSAVAAVAVSGSLAFTGVGWGATATPDGLAGVRPAGVGMADPNGCVQVRHLADNGVEATNVSCGRTVSVQAIWSTPPNSRSYSIPVGGSRDYYPHFSWQHYVTIKIV